jgi:hypothetical protein
MTVGNHAESRVYEDWHIGPPAVVLKEPREADRNWPTAPLTIVVGELGFTKWQHFYELYIQYWVNYCKIQAQGLSLSILFSSMIQGLGLNILNILDTLRLIF